MARLAAQLPTRREAGAASADQRKRQARARSVPGAEYRRVPRRQSSFETLAFGGGDELGQSAHSVGRWRRPHRPARSPAAGAVQGFEAGGDMRMGDAGGRLRRARWRGLAGGCGWGCRGCRWPARQASAGGLRPAAARRPPLEGRIRLQLWPSDKRWRRAAVNRPARQRRAAGSSSPQPSRHRRWVRAKPLARSVALSMA